MKALKITIIVILVVMLVGLLGLFLSIKNFDANRYKPQIIAQVKQNLKRDVDFQDIALGLSFQDGITLNLKEFKIKDHPNFQDGDLFKVGQISLKLNALKLLTKHEIDLSGIRIDSPDIVIIRRQDGQVNVQTIGQNVSENIVQPNASAGSQSSTTGNWNATAKPALVSLKGIPHVFINAIQMNNGHVVLIDKTFNPEIKVDLAQISMKIERFSLSQPFNIVADAAVFNTQPNIHGEGTVQINLASNTIRVSNFKFSTDLSKFSIADLNKVLGSINKEVVPDRLAGQIQILVKELTSGGQGVSVLSMDMDFSNGKFGFEKFPGGVPLQIALVNFKVQDFSFDKPFTFSLKTAVMSEQPDVSVDGQGQLNLEKREIKLEKTNAAIDLSLLSLPQIKSSLSLFLAAAAEKDPNKGIPPNLDEVLPENLSGKLNITIDDLTLNPQGLSSASVNGELAGGRLKLKQLLVPVDTIHSSFKATNSIFSVTDLSCSVGKGKITSQGGVDDYWGEQKFDFTVDLQDLFLEDIVDQSALPGKIQGSLSGKIQSHGQGLDPKKMLDSLSGGGNLEIKDGKLTDWNILKLILAKIPMIPNLVPILESQIPEPYQTLFAQNETILQKALFSLTIEKGEILIEPAEVEVEGYLLSGKGTMQFNQDFDIKGTLAIQPELSAKMVASVNELQPLEDEEYRIILPVQLERKNGKFNYAVDGEYLVKKFIKSKATEEFGKVLNKIFKNDDQPAQDPSSPDGANPSGQETNAQAGEKMIKNIFDTILK